MNAASLSDIVIPDTNRQRLGTLLERARRAGYGRQEVLDFLEEKLEFARPVAADQIPNDVITMNSKFSARDSVSEEVATYHLVYPESADSGVNCVATLTK